jgi:phage baseplate assembly protein gpV
MFSLSKDPNTVTIEFTINGAVSKLSPHVLEVQVYKQINKIARARIKIHDGDVANQKFELIETYTPKIGDTIEIKIGGDPTSVKSTFKGVVSGLSAELNTIYNQIIIDCVDKAFGMTKGRNTSIYLKKKDDAIIKALVGNYSGVTITTDSCTVEHEKLVQYGVSDWDFLLMRAEANGFLVANADNAITAKKPILTAAATGTFSNGTDILSVSVENTGEPAIDSMSVQHWDYDTGTVKVGKSDSTDKPTYPTIVTSTAITGLAKPKEPISVYTAGIYKENDLKGIVNGKVVRSMIATVKGHVTVNGNVTVKLTDIIELKGLGKFSGKFFCSGIEHNLIDGAFTTTFIFGIDEKSIWEKDHSVNNETLGGTISPVFGLHLGTVVKLDGDPNTQLRIQIKLPVFGSDALVWARLSFPDAGKNRGIFFVPEKDDEVVVSFLDGDPSQPIILGTLYNKKSTTPHTWDAKNNIRKIVSKNKVEIEFDDEKKNLTLKTPGGNSILMDDAKGITIKDKNGNSIELGSAGITIKSAKDASLKAAKNVTVSGDAGAVTVSGLDVTADAKKALKVAGKATAEISASGIVTVKGAMVKIN